MVDLSDFKRGQIVGVRMVGVRVTKTAELFGVARCTVSKIMTEFVNNILIKAKLWKKAKTVLQEPLHSYADYLQESQEYSSENYRRA